MQRHKILKILLSALAITAITTSAIWCDLGKNDVWADSDTTVSAEKTEPVNASKGSVSSREEVIYSVLSPSGVINSTYSVNILNVDNAGVITDYGDYSNVTNLTNINAIDYDDSKVSVKAGKGAFYYQGDMNDSQLPWTFDISYTLDGDKINSEDLAGASGNLGITIKTSANDSIDNCYYDNYMIQTSITLSNKNCTNIKASGAAIANSGEDKLITFTTMPSEDTNIKLSANVSDFEMTGISFAAIPFSMDIGDFDTDELTSQFGELTDAVEELNSGISAIDDGASELADGSETLADGSSQLKSGLSSISKNSSSLVSGSSKILKALNTMNNAFNSSEDSSFSIDDIEKLSSGLSAMSSGIESISDNLTKLNTGYTKSLQALSSAISSIPEDELTEDQLASIEALIAANPSDADTLMLLLDNYKAARTIKGTYEQVSSGLDAVSNNIPVVTTSLDSIKENLDTMSAGIDDMISSDMFESLGSLQTGISTMAKQYKSFHSGLKKYTNGIDEISRRYKAMDSGFSTISKGTGSLSKGISDYASGMNTFNSSVSTMPDQVQDQIDSMLSQFDTSDMKLVSFTSSNNTNTDSVQFVIQTQDIQKPEIKEEAKTPEPQTLLSKIKALFK